LVNPNTTVLSLFLKNNIIPTITKAIIIRTNSPPPSPAPIAIPTAVSELHVDDGCNNTPNVVTVFCCCTFTVSHDFGGGG